MVQRAHTKHGSVSNSDAPSEDESGMNISPRGSPHFSTPEAQSQCPWPGEDPPMFWPHNDALGVVPTNTPEFSTHRYTSANMQPVSRTSMPTPNYWPQWSEPMPTVSYPTESAAPMGMEASDAYLKTRDEFYRLPSSTLSPSPNMNASSYNSTLPMDPEIRNLPMDNRGYAEGMESPNAVKVTFTLNESNKFGTMTDLMRIAMEHKAPFRVERD